MKSNLSESESIAFQTGTLLLNEEEIKLLLKLSDARPYLGREKCPWTNEKGGLVIPLGDLKIFESAANRTGNEFIKNLIPKIYMLDYVQTKMVLTQYYLALGIWEQCPLSSPKEGPCWKSYTCRFVDYLFGKDIHIAEYVNPGKRPGTISYLIPQEILLEVSGDSIFLGKKNPDEFAYQQYLFGDSRMCGYLSNTGFLPVQMYPLLYQTAKLKNPMRVEKTVVELFEEVKASFVMKFGYLPAYLPNDNSTYVNMNKKGHYQDYFPEKKGRG